MKTIIAVTKLLEIFGNLQKFYIKKVTYNLTIITFLSESILKLRKMY